MTHAGATVVDGVDGLQSYLERLQGEVLEGDYSDTLQAIADEMKIIHGGYFSRGAGPDGVPWIKWYFREPKVSADHPTLVVTGRLRDSLISDGPDHVEDIDPHSLVFGTTVPYSAQLDEGGTYPVDTELVGRRGERRHPGQLITLPARPHVGVNEGHVDQFAEMVGDAARAKVNAIEGI